MDLSTYIMIKQAAGAVPDGLISSMNPAHSPSLNAQMQPQQQQPQGPGQPQKPMSYWNYTKTYGDAPIEKSWTDWIPLPGFGRGVRQSRANIQEYNNYVKQMQAQNRQMLGQQQGQQQPPQGQQQPMQQQAQQGQQQQAPQGVDPNQWQQFQRFQQMMQQFPAPQDDKMQKMQKQWENIQKNPLGTGLGMV